MFNIESKSRFRYLVLDIKYYFGFHYYDFLAFSFFTAIFLVKCRDGGIGRRATFRS